MVPLGWIPRDPIAVLPLTAANTNFELTRNTSRNTLELQAELGTVTPVNWQLELLVSSGTVTVTPNSGTPELRTPGTVTVTVVI